VRAVLRPVVFFIAIIFLPVCLDVAIHRSGLCRYR
jgi:hypothetical protein